jgi:hypothetical protein
MKRIILAIALVMLLAVPPVFADALTPSNEGIRDYTKGGKHFRQYYVTLTQVDADPSDDTHIIGNSYWTQIAGSPCFTVGVDSQTSDSTVTVKIQGEATSATRFWTFYSNSHTYANFPELLKCDSTMDQYPPLIGPSGRIAFGNDWANSASGDNVTIHIVVPMKDTK